MARNRADLAEVAARIRSRGGRAFAFQADVSREEQVERLAKHVESVVHLLVNSAAAILRKPLLEITSGDQS